MSRIICAISLLWLLVVCAGCGSSPTQSPTAYKTPSDTPLLTATPVLSSTPTPVVGPQFTLVLVSMVLSPPSAGFQQVTIGFGIRNDAPSPYSLDFSSDTPPSLSIQEGRTYDAHLNVSFENDYNYPHFEVPPGLTFCGIEDFGLGSVALEATAQIPQHTTPNVLTLSKFAPLDLTSTPTPTACMPKMSPNTPHLPSDVTIGTRGTSTNGAIHIQSIEKTTDLTTLLSSGPGFIVHVTVQNFDTLDSFTTTDLYVWAIGDDGIVRDLTLTSASGHACAQNPLAYNVGPSQTVDDQYCFRSTSKSIMMLVFQSSANNLYQIVNMQ